jgi:hypothetical protein
MKKGKLMIAPREDMCFHYNLTNRGGSIPFTRMLMLDYYDGPGRAITFCDVCGQAFLAILIDWNSDHSLRVFSLARVPAEIVDELLAIFPETPRWPLWFPSQLIAPTQKTREALEKLEPVFDSLPPPEGLLAWLVPEDRAIRCEPVKETWKPHLSGSLLNDGEPTYDWIGTLRLTV